MCRSICVTLIIFFFNDTATTEIYTLSLHDALPILMNILNGGAHADTGVDVQEFMVAPIGAGTFAEALRQGAEVYRALKSVLKKNRLATGLGGEGGFAPDVPSSRATLDLIGEAVAATGLTLGDDIALAMDVAAAE